MMPSTGIIRKLDALGRIVVPKEIYDTLGAGPGTPMEIFINGNIVILQKYSPGCVICENIDDISYFKGKKVCRSCLKDASGISDPTS